MSNFGDVKSNQIKSNLFFKDARQIRYDNIAYSRTSSGKHGKARRLKTQRWSRGHKARGQGQGHKKNPEAKAKAKDSLSEDKHSRGQGQECSRPRPRTKDTSASALQKKKKRSSQKFFKRSPRKNVFQKNFSNRSTKF